MSEALAVFDVDGTQFKSACVEKVTDEAIRQGIFDAENFAEAYAKRRLWQANNNEGVYRSYLHHFVGGFVASMAGVEVDVFNKVIEATVVEHRVRLFSYTRQLAQILKPSHKLVAISGSPQIVVEPFLDSVGFDTIVGSKFDVQDGRFTGKAESVDKEVVLAEIAAEQDISVAIGDTVGDLPVLKRAKCPIAFNPSATLRQSAETERWPIVIEQKDNIMQLLPKFSGYEVSFERAPSLVLDWAGIEL